MWSIIDNNLAMPYIIAFFNINYSLDNKFLNSSVFVDSNVDIHIILNAFLSLQWFF